MSGLPQARPATRAPWIAALLLLLTVPTTAPGQNGLRPMVVDDLFTIETLTTTALSPDAERVAVVVQRARSVGESHARPYMWGDERGDIWLLPVAGGAARNLTRGARDRTGYWAPVWSPDGARLALLSTRGGDNIRLFVWDGRSGRITRLTTAAVDLQTTIEAADGRTGSFLWLDNTTLLTALLPEGMVAPRFEVTTRTARIAPAEWARAERGEEAAVSVLETGPDVRRTELPAVSLVVLDVARGTTRVVGELPQDPHGRRVVKLAPDGRHLAVLVGDGHVTLDDVHPLGRQRNRRDRLGLLTLDGSAAPRWFDEAVFTSLGSWAPDGSAIAVRGKLEEWWDQSADHLFTLRPDGGVHRITPDGYQVSSAVWTADGRPVALARPAPQRVGMARSEPANGQAAWLRIEPDGSAIDVLPDLPSAPTTLVPTGSADVYVGVVDGDLWRVDVSAATGRNLTADLPAKVGAIVFPADGHVPSAPLAEVVVEAEADGVNEFYVVRVAGPPAVEVLDRPSRRAVLRDYVPGSGAGLFLEAGPTGTFLWSRSGDSGRFQQLLARNQHLAGIADAQRMLFEYRGIEGDTLKGMVLLPPGHEPGERHPLVAWVYAGSVRRDTTFILADKNQAHPLNLLPLVSRGYAVLVPSMPLLPEGIPSDPYIELPKGVLTAVDKLVELGIADPDRLAVMGQSFGGYSTFSLVTYTHRFKAAISLAGPSNLVSLYGQFDVRTRYTDTPHENLFMPMLSEGGQVRMGATPWDNLWRYLRNTPLFFVDRVQTPLMIVGADQDYVTMTQGEEFFLALHRQGKRARFVRYWGDDHVITSPGNVRHLWSQIFDWLDRHMMEESAP